MNTNSQRDGDGEPQVPPAAAERRQITLLGLGFVALATLLVYALASVWPVDIAAGAKGGDMQSACLLGTDLCTELSIDVRLLLLVVVAGALGSFVHAATSFGDFVGNRKLAASWIWWYLLKPFIGMALAVIFYLAVRGGFLSSGGSPGQINVFGIAALAGMVGMFSKQATDKLSEVFDTLFRTNPEGGDARRKDDLKKPPPDAAIQAGTADEAQSDGCDVEVTRATPDEALPPSRGGVAP